MIENILATIPLAIIVVLFGSLFGAGIMIFKYGFDHGYIDEVKDPRSALLFTVIGAVVCTLAFWVGYEFVWTN